MINSITLSKKKKHSEYFIAWNVIVSIDADIISTSVLHKLQISYVLLTARRRHFWQTLKRNTLIYYSVDKNAISKMDPTNVLCVMIIIKTFFFLLLFFSSLNGVQKCVYYIRCVYLSHEIFHSKLLFRTLSR